MKKEFNLSQGLDLQSETMYTERQMELIGWAFGEVEGVYETGTTIREANQEYVGLLEPLVDQGFKIGGQARCEGWEWNWDNYDLFEVRQNLFELKLATNEKYFPHSGMEAIKLLLNNIFFVDRESYDYGVHLANKKFRSLLAEREDTVYEFSSKRCNIVRGAEENELEADFSRRKSPSDLREKYFQVSERLSKKAKEEDSSLREKEDGIIEENEERYIRFRGFVDDLVEAVKPEDASFEGL